VCQLKNKKMRFEQKEWCSRYQIVDLKLYYRATVTKTAWYWHKNRLMDQWNRRSRNKPVTAIAIWFLTKVPKTYIGEKTPFNKWWWENWIFLCRRLKLEFSLLPCTKINPKWITDFNVRTETLKPPEENRENPEK
jgi:hypothetical protein